MNYCFLEGSATEKIGKCLEEGQRSQAFHRSNPKKKVRMKTSKLFASVVVMFLLILLLSACGGGQADAQSAEEPASEPVTQPTAEKVAEEPTVEPTPVPEVEPEIIDLGYDSRLLVRGLPNDVTLEANVDLSMKENIPDSRYFDNVHSEITLVRIIKNGGPAILEKGVAELCYTTTLTPGMGEQPVPFYWDTSNNPLLDGRPLRVSNVEKEPALVVCSMVETSGAYALIAR